MSKPHPLSLPIESLRPGTFSDSTGHVWTFTEQDIVDMAAGYDPARSPAPVVIGHPKMDDPAVGLIQSAAMVNAKLNLTLNQASLDPAFAADVAAKKFYRVSLRLFTPTHPANPNPGKWSIRHLGFLGAFPPAIPGLAPVFAAGPDDGPVVDFSCGLEGPWWSLGAIVRRLRDWMISSQGLDTADNILPEWNVSAIEDAARMPAETEDDDFPAASFATPQETTVTPEQAAALAAENVRLKAQLDAANAVAATAARSRRHDDNVAFAAALVADPAGPKLAPQQQARAVALLDAMGELEQQVEFATGDGTVAKEAPAFALAALLKSVGPLVPAGEAGGGADHTADFASASPGDGAASRTELHNKALAYAKANKVTYAEAVQACIAQ